MNFRNPSFTANGAITCEVEHLSRGWIPYTMTGAEDWYTDVVNDNPAPYVAPLSQIDLATVKSDAVRFLAYEHDRNLGELAGNPTPYEIASWSAKREAAQARLDGIATAKQNETLQLYGNLRGMDEDAYANYVVSLSNNLELLSAAFEGVKRTAELAIEAATTATEVQAALDAVVWPTVPGS